jgi:predicted DsbA family dithiol-disulfide isomerase
MKIKVDIFSDAICPWCYVGKKRLEKAVTALSPDHAFEIRWHPFQLNPQTPAEGVDRAEYLARKFGGGERLREMDAKMKEVGRGEGIEFKQEKILKTPNTLNAHRLIGWSARTGNQDALVENLFRAYFTEGRDIGDAAVLARVAGESGLSATEAAVFLAGEEGRAEVLKAEEEIKRAGVRGVPFFILNGRAFLEGAEPPEAFIQAVGDLSGVTPS